MKEVIHRVKCNGVMHRVIVGEDGLTFPDHDGIWEEAQRLGLVARLGASIPIDQVRGGCIALAAYAKLGRQVIPTPKVGTGIIDLLHKRAAVRARLQAAAEIPEPAEKVQARLREEVLRTLRRCSYKHRASKADSVCSMKDFFHTHSMTVADYNWVSTYKEEDWYIRVQIGWLSHVLAPGRAVVAGHFIAAIDPDEQDNVVAIYECTSKDQHDGALLRRARIVNKKLVWV